MPKIVVPSERRKAVSEAVIRVISRAGIERATLRNVAKEAGLAIGSVQHYFANREELLIFTLNELGQRIVERVDRRGRLLLEAGPDADRAQLVEDLFAEFLPLDAKRWDESVAWLAFAVAARTHDALQPLAAEQHQFMRGLVARVLQEAVAGNSLPEDLDIDVESVRLSALLDGLTLQRILQPGTTTPAVMVAALRRNLRTLGAATA